MRTQGRHLAPGAGPRRGSIALMLCAGLLLGLCSLGVTGVGFLSHLRALESPHSDVASQSSSSPEALVSPGDVPPSHAADEDWRALVSTPLTGLPEAARERCTLPASGSDAGSDDDEQRLTALADCLDRVWAPPVRAAGLRFEPVSIRVMDPAHGTPGQCGRTESVVPAAYCEADRTIYVSPRTLDHDAQMPEIGDLLLVSTVAHEYGHHLQSLVGLLTAARTYEAAHPGSEGEVTRRLETMATCLGAGTHAVLDGPLAVTQGYYEQMTATDTYRSDPDHGTATTQALWARNGYDSPGRASACATFSAPARLVR